MSIKDVEPGRVVCVEGRGEDATIHRHVKVARVTKTMIILENGSRYRRETVAGSIPYQPYGGSSIHLTCQRQKEKS